MINFKKKLNQSGVAALFIVVVIAGSALLMARGVAMLSLGEVDMSYQFDKAEEVMAIAEGCAEESLRRLQLDGNFSATDLQLPLGRGFCIINIISSGEDKIIEIEAKLENFHKNISLDITLDPDRIIIKKWQELS
jgi:hypothetical protein